MADRKASLSGILFYTCVCVLTICLVVGFIFAGGWIWAVVGLANGAIWYFVRKQNDTIFAHFTLVLSVGLAATVSLLGGSALLAISVSMLGLAAWDLRYLDQSLANSTLDEKSRRYQVNHLKALGMVLFVSIILIAIGFTVKLDLPFFVLFILVVAVIIGWEGTWHFINKI